MLSKKLKDCLDSNRIAYTTMQHKLAYTAQETAGSAHVPGKEFAKTVILKADNRMIMAVLPASRDLDLRILKESLGAKDLRLAHEHDFRDLFPECDTGAMPPFGNLYGVDVIAAKTLTEQDSICFNAGTHRDLVKLKYRDFEKVVKPKVLKCTMVQASIPMQHHMSDYWE
ncbi:MAG: deacylase [SAR324 cluster bacterium]|uniref:Deacylase n=1 Tax=SAR324 cluster bacterium TaxID=2024889 RepID=A0A2A4SMS5_9DELT|nr:MAG: deacylase [SAR324 cluster bacterium]